MPTSTPWSGDPDSTDPVTFNLGEPSGSEAVVYFPEPLDSASGSSADGDWTYDLGDDDYDHDGKLIRNNRPKSRLLDRPQGNRRIAQAYDRRRKVVEMRIEGHTFPEIARTLRFNTVEGCRQAFKRAMQDTTDVADQYRDLELARLEKATSVLWPMVETGDLEAIDKYLKIAQLRSKLAHLDKIAPPGYEAGGVMNMGTDGPERVQMVEDVNLFLAALPGIVAMSPQPKGSVIDHDHVVGSNLTDPLDPTSSGVDPINSSPADTPGDQGIGG